MAERWLGAAQSFAGGGLKGEGRHIQLLLDMDVELPDGSLLPLKILVDTGAQVNLVKRGLVSRQDWKIAQNPVRLITANNSA